MGSEMCIRDSSMTDRAPIDAPDLMTTPFGSQSLAPLACPLESIALGYMSFVSIAPGPIKTPSPISAGS